MADQKTPDDDKASLAFGATLHLIDSQKSSDNLDCAATQLNQVIHEFSPKSNQPISHQQKIKTAILHFCGFRPRIKARIDWLKSTGRFDKRQLRLIRNANVFYEDENGNVCLRQKGIAIEIAMLGLFIVGFTLGLIVFWLWTTKITLSHICWSYCIGTIAGTLIGILRDRSVGFVKIKKDILAVAPWLTGSPSKKRL